MRRVFKTKVECVDLPSKTKRRLAVGVPVFLRKSATGTGIQIALDEGTILGSLASVVGSQVATAIDRGQVFTASIEHMNLLSRETTWIYLKVEYILERGQPAIEIPKEEPEGEWKSFYTKVAGDTHQNSDGSDRQNIIRKCRTGERVQLVREPDNPEDSCAVKVLRTDGEQLGYLPSGVARSGVASGRFLPLFGCVECPASLVDPATSRTLRTTRPKACKINPRPRSWSNQIGDYVRYFAFGLIAFTVLHFFVPLAQAGDTDFARNSLRGLGGVSVIVEDLPAGVEQGGLTRSAIETDVELKLRQAGIVVGGVPARSPGILHVSVNVLTTEPPPFWPYVVLVELQQDSWLVRRIAGQWIPMPLVATWSTTIYGNVPSFNLRSLRDVVKDQADKFINAYLSVNPRTSSDPHKTDAVKRSAAQTKAEPSAKLGLQEKCAQGARAAFKAGGWERNPLVGFTNHYNDKMGKCFIQIAEIDTRTSPGTTWIAKRLLDAFEGKVYGEYDWESNKTEKAGEVRPVDCYVIAASGERKTCKSVEEFDALVKLYVEQ